MGKRLRIEANCSKPEIVAVIICFVLKTALCGLAALLAVRFVAVRAENLLTGHPVELILGTLLVLATGICAYAVTSGAVLFLYRKFVVDAGIVSPDDVVFRFSEKDSGR